MQFLQGRIRPSYILSRFMCLLLMSTCSTILVAADLSVCAGCTYTTIQSTVADANPGDRILVLDPLHIESNISLAGTVGLTIQGQGENATIVPAAAMPDLTNPTIFVLQGVTDVTLSDMTLRHGGGVSDLYDNQSGGAVHITDSTNVTLEAVSFTDWDLAPLWWKKASPPNGRVTWVPTPAANGRQAM